MKTMKAIMILSFLTGLFTKKVYSQECDLINYIIAGKHLSGPAYVVRNYNPGSDQMNTENVNRVLAKYFPTRQDSIFNLVFKTAPVPDKRKLDCGKDIDFISVKKAEKVAMRSHKYSPSDYRHDLYGLRHGNHEYTAFYFSTPIYFGDYAAIKCTERRHPKEGKYDIYLMKKVDGKWIFVDVFDFGYDSFK